EDGVYVITGGSGRLGLVMARHLASKGKINIALINRTPLPEQMMWEQLAAHDDDAKLTKQLRALQDIRSTGAQVECLALDVTSMADMSLAMQQLRDKYGAINGVI